MYEALAFYHFVPIENPHAEVERHRIYFNRGTLTGRIYISEEGINGQMSGPEEEIHAYKEWLKESPLFASIHFKSHRVSENVFPRMTVKYRSQLVALDVKVDMSQRAESVSPEQWKEMLESGQYVVLDVRNQYEWEIGHFEQATLLPLQNFRDFAACLEQLEIDPNSKIMMYCTGGIRCELYSALLKKKGFQHLYQLDGGVIEYGLRVGTAHWRGKLFVFDDRLAVPIDEKSTEIISKCAQCSNPSDTYYNCANMDCNELFIACLNCLKENKGCCCTACTTSSRVREFDEQRGNKPFRRKHLL